MRVRHLVAQRQQLVTLKLDQPLAPLAVQVVVLRISVIVFVDRAAIELEFAE